MPIVWCEPYIWKSRSPRSVWVEIFLIGGVFPADSHAPHGACELKFLFSYRRGVFPVTLPTERVSWNFLLFFPLFLLVLSRSPRSVWVEIIFLLVDSQPTFVTLPTERVSWNLCKNWKWLEISSHAPHGACELKFPPLFLSLLIFLSRSPRSVWVEILTVFCL